MHDLRFRELLARRRQQSHHRPVHVRIQAHRQTELRVQPHPGRGARPDDRVLPRHRQHPAADVAAARDAELHRPGARNFGDGRGLRQPVRPVRRPGQELRYAGADGQRRLRVRNRRLDHLPPLRRQPEAVVPPPARIRFDDGARGSGQRRQRQGDRPRRTGVDQGPVPAGLRLHRPHQ